VGWRYLPGWSLRLSRGSVDSSINEL